MQSVEMLIACEKTVLAEAGILNSPFCREPGYSLSAAQLRELQEHMRSLGTLMLGEQWPA
jgi:hypothetical protein